MEFTVERKSSDKSSERWQLLAEKLKNAGCKYSRLQIIREGFLVFLNTNENLCCLTANERTSDLSNYDFIVVVIQKVISKKTVIIWNVDKSLFQKEENYLALELIHYNQWLKVAKVSKLTIGYQIKFEFDEVHLANQCLENGVFMYSFSYLPRISSIHRHNTSESNMTEICLRCYACNDHLTNICTKPRGNKICSECSSTNHSLRNCHSPTTMCVNCLGDHRIMSNQCPNVKLIEQQQF